MNYASLPLFTLTAAVSCFAPGPAVLFVASTVATNGKKHIPACVGGIVIANLVYFLAAATGIASLIIAYPSLCAAVRLTGAGYLAYLGFALSTSTGGELTLNGRDARSTHRTSFSKAFLIEIANPKALLYFSALLPQFVDPLQAIVRQLVVYSSITIVLDVASYTGYGLLGAFSVRTASTRVIRIIKKSAGILFVVVSARLAIGG